MATFCLNPDKDREQVKANIHAFIDRLPPTKAWEVTIEPYRKERSLRQLGALFGVAYKALSEQTGFTKDELHTYFCGEYFGWQVVDFFGQKKKKPLRTTTTNERGEKDVINTEQQAEMYQFIQMRSAENGLFVPDPDPLHYQNN